MKLLKVQYIISILSLVNHYSKEVRMQVDI